MGSFFIRHCLSEASEQLPVLLFGDGHSRVSRE